MMQQHDVFINLGISWYLPVISQLKTHILSHFNGDPDVKKYTLDKL